MDKLAQEQKEVLIYRLDSIKELLKNDKILLAFLEIENLLSEIESDNVMPF